jgi:ppGpp synthetase/RelA/SpoT-type nucleotidyltranferase
MSLLTKSQVDRLGERLKQGSVSDTELRLLDEYRRSFGPAYDAVVNAIRRQARFATTGRRAKTTTSIIAKLRREHVRLSQIQDIAGCRIVVADTAEQERALTALLVAFPGALVHDRRKKPSHGYRAVHVIARVGGKPVEIQVRTKLQHLWAEISERLSDLLDPRLKYGVGPEPALELLQDTSQLIAHFENLEQHNTPAVLSAADIDELARQRADLRRQLGEQLQKMIEDLDVRRSRK